MGVVRLKTSWTVVTHHLQHITAYCGKEPYPLQGFKLWQTMHILSKDGYCNKPVASKHTSWIPNKWRHNVDQGKPGDRSMNSITQEHLSAWAGVCWGADRLKLGYAGYLNPSWSNFTHHIGGAVVPQHFQDFDGLCISLHAAIVCHSLLLALLPPTRRFI